MLPRRPVAQRAGIGCVAWGLIIVLAGGTLLVGSLLLVAALVLVRSPSGATAADPREPDGETQQTTVGTVTASAKGGAPIAAKGKLRDVESAFASGTCDDRSKERTRATYDTTRGSGTARRLRGKVAALQLRLGTRGSSWTAAGEGRVDHAALAAARFLTDQAKLHGVEDLAIDVIPWTLTSPYQLPVLRLQADHTLPNETIFEIERGSRAALEVSLATSLDAMSRDLRQKGYDEVAFLVYFPVEVNVRDWAIPAGRSSKRAEAGYIFSPLSSAFGDFSWVVSHESLHLFGADDLYRLQAIDADDKGDVMDAYCTGFARAHVGDATSYAIGWRATPPKRPYGFKDF